MDKKYKIIFLDFDGVINGSSPSRYIIWKILSFLHLKKLYDVLYRVDVYGVHEDKVRRLSKICKATGAYVVFTSSWRDVVYDAMLHNKKSDHRNVEDMCNLFAKYDIPVLGSVPHSTNNTRQSDIIEWLAKYESVVENYIILDDEWGHLFTLRNRLILTTDANPEKRIAGRWYCREGLRNTHVKRAIEMLGDNYLH